MSDSPRPKRPSGLTTPDPDTLRRLLDVEQAILSRTSEKDIDPTLDTVREVMDLLGDPQRSYPVIHLTGTNGKTSTTRMIDSLLTALGLTTGRFTSPHLHSFRERITIGGEPIDPERAYTIAVPDFIPLSNEPETVAASKTIGEVLWDDLNLSASST